MTARSIQTATRAELMSREDFIEYVDSVFAEIRAEAIAVVVAEADRMAEALEATAEALELSLQRLGVAGEGDGKDRKADVDSWGGNNALTDARAALAAHEEARGK